MTYEFTTGTENSSSRLFPGGINWFCGANLTLKLDIYLPLTARMLFRTPSGVHGCAFPK